MNPLHISAQFDSGAIDVISVADPHDIQVAIRKDNAAEFAQWFHFALQGAAQVPVTIRFMNAGSCAYPDGWVGYQVVASHDRQHWFRIDTAFDGKVMAARLTPETPVRLPGLLLNPIHTSSIWIYWARYQHPPTCSKSA